MRLKPNAATGEERLLHSAVKHMHFERTTATKTTSCTRSKTTRSDFTKGDLLDDAPEYSWDELVELANNRDVWRKMVKRLRRGDRVQIDMGPTTVAGADVAVSIASAGPFAITSFINK